VLVTKPAIRKYVENAFAALAPGGIFFGSTLGFGKGMPRHDPNEQIPPEWHRRRRRPWRWVRWLARRVTFLSQEGLQHLFEQFGFTDIEIMLDDTRRRLWFYAKKP
jgi:hypothetical protein